MKPINLEIKNFGPFAEKVTIDFEVYDEGLYLVSGDTGAGKTSIFDAITYALFDVSSGSARSNRMLRSDFAKDDEETYVNFTFTHRNEQFTIKRTPAYDRLKKRGEGTTPQAATVLLTLENGQAYDNLFDVNARIIQILGMDALQFKQIVMIAQGDFLRLLNASSQERSDIFRKVFDTTIYQKIQQKLKDKSNEIRLQLDRDNKTIQENLNQVQPNFDDSLNPNDSEAYLNWIRALIDTQTLNYNEIESKIKEITVRRDAVLEMRTRAENDNANLVSLEKALNQQNILNDQKHEMQNKAVLIELLTQIKTQLMPIEDHLQIEVNRLESIESKIISEAQTLKDIKGVLSSLQSKKIEITDLESTLDSRSIELSTLQNSLVKYQLLDALVEKIAEQEKTVEDYKQLIDAGLAKENKLKESIDTIEKTKDLLNDNVELLNKLKLSHQQTIQDLSLKSEKLDQVLRLENLENNRVVEHTALLSYLKEYETLLNHYNHEELIFYRAQAGILAELLVDGEPCSVCGSLNHPKKAHLEHTVLTKQELDNLKAKLETSKNNLDKQQKILNEIVGSMSQYDDTKRVKSDDLNQEIKALRLKEATIKEDIFNLEKTLNEQKNQVASYSSLREKEGVIFQENQQLQVKHDDIMVQIKINVQKMETLKSELYFSSFEVAQKKYQDDSNILEQDKVRIKNYKTELTDAERRVSTSEGLLKEFEQQKIDQEQVVSLAKGKLRTTLETLNINKEQFATLKNDLVNLTTYNNEVKQFESSTQSNIITIKDLQERTRDKVYTDMDVMNQNFNELEELKQKYQDTLSTTRLMLETNHRIYDKLNLLRKKRHTLENDFGIYETLSRSANGELVGKDRITLENYVQSAYFEYIIDEANKRFIPMTNQRYELYRQQEASNKRSKSGLDLEVLDHYTGKRRGVKSLSGGESFKASLALALGLSDVIQKMSGVVSVDAMFIDEGFGTLDESSLQQALKSLSDLASNKRTVGIISHVPELRHQIDQQIIVSKSETGSTVKQQF